MSETIDKVEKLCGKIEEKFEKFKKEVAAALKPNHAAAVRARKISLDIATDLKEFRSVSVSLKK